LVFVRQKTRGRREALRNAAVYAQEELDLYIKGKEEGGWFSIPIYRVGPNEEVA
jgi:hypothetical protein